MGFVLCLRGSARYGLVRRYGVSLSSFGRGEENTLRIHIDLAGQGGPVLSDQCHPAREDASASRQHGAFCLEGGRRCVSPFYGIETGAPERIPYSYSGSVMSSALVLSGANGHSRGGASFFLAAQMGRGANTRAATAPCAEVQPPAHGAQRGTQAAPAYSGRACPFHPNALTGAPRAALGILGK